MDFRQSELFAISTVDELNLKLGFSLFKYLKSEKIIDNYKICIRNGRLLEIPKPNIKAIQHKILFYLQQISLPSYYNSKKGKNHIENARIHSFSKGQVLKTDICKFFPRTKRNLVYHFWKDKMCVSGIVAQVLTNVTTIDYHNYSFSEDIQSFFKSFSISDSHLPTGAPTSILLSYLANCDMYEELKMFADKNSFCFTSYVDDLVFSSNYQISHQKFLELRKIVSKHGYKLSTSKTKNYDCSRTYSINGVKIYPDGKLDITDLKHKEIRKLEKNGVNHNRLQGLLNYRKQILKTI